MSPSTVSPWGARAADWALNEDRQVPTYAAVLDRAGLAPGDRMLDVGCGTGAALAVAAARGAEVAGVDAAGPLLELARERVPDADLREADMEALPFPDDAFDLVTGFNAFFFASDMVAALREAGRVARPGAPVAIQVWGRPERCDLTAMKQAIAPWMPSGPAGPELWRPGVLEDLAAQAGLRPGEAFDLSWAYEYPDADTLARGMLSPGPVQRAIAAGGEEAVREAILSALEPYRVAGGGYRLANEWHVLMTTS